MRKPLEIDLFCGLGGWTEGLLAEGYHVVGFDIERHDYGSGGYPPQLVLQDVRTLHGAQFRNADLIVASPPCQFFSRMAMPFKMPWNTVDYERRRNLAHDLFWQCWRIQHEATKAAGREIPMVVENVVGAQKWVGRSRFAYGSFHLWGDVPALMPTPSGQKNTGGSWFGQRDGKPLERNDPRDMRADEDGEFVNASASGGWNHPGKALDGRKRPGRRISPGFNNWPKDESGAYIMPDGTKQGGDWFSDPNCHSRRSSSRSLARKAASAQIAKIPLPLSRWIGRVYYPYCN